MNFARIALGVTAFGLVACMAGCSSDKQEDDDSAGALTNVSQPGDWVVDMTKVAKPTREGGYGRSTSLFFGLGPQEYLCAQGESADTCKQKPALWDQAQRFGPNLKEDGSVEFRKPYANDKVQPLVKLADGTVVGPKGKGLNIIPLLKNTDPTAQVYLRKWLKNGDALVFFHPEQSGMRSLMDRRASHAAMHYDYKSPLVDKEFVHHVDNPNNYGPRYNYQPSRNMPFHVFRFQPKGMDTKKAEAYALAARNYAFMDDDLSPFADFFDLQLQTRKDLKTKFQDKLLAGTEINEVYCSGLVWTNLNLGTNFPLKPGTLTKDYSRRETQETFKAADCATGTEDKCVLSPATLNGISVNDLEGRNKLIYEPYTTSDLANAWLDNTFGELPFEKRAEIAAKPETQQQVGGGLYNVAWGDDGKRQEGESQAPSSVVQPENLKAWGDSYGANLQFAAAVKAGQAQQAAGVMKAYLENHKLKLRDGTTATMAALVMQHNDHVATGQQVDPDKWIQIDTTKMSPSQILRALEVAHVENRYVPPRIWMDTAEDRTWLPSGYDPRQGSEAEMVYVGTVINCELLTAADGSNKDACAVEGSGVGEGSAEFAEGGADTSTYAHYAIPNGGERTHRRFDSSTGPALMGKGTRLTVRATSYEMGDVRFLLHTPDLYNEGYSDFVNQLSRSIPADALPPSVTSAGLASMNVLDYDKACTVMNKVAASQSQRGSCAPKRAILLDLAKSEEVAANDPRAKATGAVPDAVYTFDLTKVCTIAGPEAEKMTCPVVSQKADGSGWDFASVQNVEISRTTRGRIAATMVDVGGTAAGEAPNVDAANPNAERDTRAYGLCSACGTGGAHFNQWTITIRNDH